jgi:hypothetical protein
MSLTGARFQKTSAGTPTSFETARIRLKVLAGVEAAGATCCVPLQADSVSR